jgi:hypothetical protein
MARLPAQAHHIMILRTPKKAGPSSITLIKCKPNEEEEARRKNVSLFSPSFRSCRFATWHWPLDGALVCGLRYCKPEPEPTLTRTLGITPTTPQLMFPRSALPANTQPRPNLCSLGPRYQRIPQNGIQFCWSNPNSTESTAAIEETCLITMETILVVIFLMKVSFQQPTPLPAQQISPTLLARLRRIRQYLLSQQADRHWCHPLTCPFRQ